MNLKSMKIGETLAAPQKSPSAKKVLMLMDKDVDYMDAVKQVAKEDNIAIPQLEKELEPFI